jgi:DNA-binding transcriptional regulator YiaG
MEKITVKRHELILRSYIAVAARHIANNDIELLDDMGITQKSASKIEALRINDVFHLAQINSAKIKVAINPEMLAEAITTAQEDDQSGASQEQIELTHSVLAEIQELDKKYDIKSIKEQFSTNSESIAAILSMSIRDIQKVCLTGIPFFTIVPVEPQFTYTLDYIYERSREREMIETLIIRDASLPVMSRVVNMRKFEFQQLRKKRDVPKRKAGGKVRQLGITQKRVVSNEYEKLQEYGLLERCYKLLNAFPGFTMRQLWPVVDEIENEKSSFAAPAI